MKPLNVVLRNRAGNVGQALHRRQRSEMIAHLALVVLAAGETLAPDRDLDPRQRRLLALFRKQGSATAAEMAAHLGMSARTLVQLCRDWIASGFLEYQNAARKNRSYRIGSAYRHLNA